MVSSLGAYSASSMLWSSCLLMPKTCQNLENFSRHGNAVRVGEIHDHIASGKLSIYKKKKLIFLLYLNKNVQFGVTTFYCNLLCTLWHHPSGTGCLILIAIIERNVLFAFLERARPRT